MLNEMDSSNGVVSSECSINRMFSSYVLFDLVFGSYHVFVLLIVVVLIICFFVVKSIDG